MATVNSILTRSLRLLQVLEAGETASAEEAQDALEVLNNLIDSWANESLMLFARTEHSIPYVQNQIEYTIGTGGDFNVTRPVSNGIMNAFTRTEDSDWKMTEVNNDQYQEIVVKSVESSYPVYYYYRPSFPLGKITVWPAPQGNLTFFINVKSQFTAFANVSAVVALPPGYVRALEYNLAIEIGPEYVKSTNAANYAKIEQLAMQSKEYIKNTNDKNIPELQSDAAHLGDNRSYGLYGYFFGGA